MITRYVTNYEFLNKKNDPIVDCRELITIVAFNNIKDEDIKVTLGDGIEALVSVDKNGHLKCVCVNHAPFIFINIPRYYEIGGFDKGHFDKEIDHGVSFFMTAKS